MATIATSPRVSFDTLSNQYRKAVKRPDSVVSDDSDSSYFSEKAVRDTDPTDDDVRGTVKRFVREFSKKYYGPNLPQEIAHLIGRWLCRELQQERGQWNKKLQDALNEAEIQRRKGLASSSLVQVCLERLHMLVQCCQLHDDKGQPLPQPSDFRDDYQAAILYYSQALMEVFAHLVQDHLQCLEILTPSSEAPGHVQGLTLLDALRERLDQDNKIKAELESRSQQSLSEKQQNIARSRQKQALESTLKSLESDVGKLRLELKREKDKVKALEDSENSKNAIKSKVQQLENDVKRLRKLCNKKQDYIEWLKKQFFEMTMLVNEDEKKDKDKSDPKEKRKANAGIIVGQKSTIRNETKQRDVNLTNSPNSVKSGGSADSKGSSSSVEITEEKLKLLQAKTQKLQDSLKKAMKQMSQFAKKPAKPIQLKGRSTDFKKMDFNHADVVLTFPKKINVVKDALGRSHQPPDEEPVQKTRNSKLEKSFKELQNSFANRYNRQRTGIGPTGQPKTSSLTTVRKQAVSKCLRCRKIFRPSDNHKLACCFHTKGKERIEKYGEDGKLKQVTFVWQCCGQKLDNNGCTSDHHV